MSAVEIDPMPIGRSMSRRVIFAAAALVFAVSAAAAIIWSESMTTMPGMPMPGGWTMPMAWMRMPGQSWPGAAASFLGMWTVMMVAMMLPSLTPVLWRYREAVDKTGGSRAGWLALQAGLGYFLVWVLLGAAIFPLGTALAALEMERPAVAPYVPLAGGLVILAAGALQFTAWKQRQLACCRSAPGSRCLRREDAGAAWVCGFRLGLRCVACCAGLTAILLVIGVMDLGAMIIVTAAITAERVLPGGGRVARVIGLVAIGAGLVLTLQAAGLA